MEIIRRLLLAIGGLVAAIGVIVAVVIATESTGDDLAACFVGMFASIGGFFGWRSLVNWVLLYSDSKKPAQKDW